MAHHLGPLWFLAKVSTSFMNRRHSSSSHGKAMHCTATGSPTDPCTACQKCQSEPASCSQAPCPAFLTTCRYASIQISHPESILRWRCPGPQSSRLPQNSFPAKTVLTLFVYNSPGLRCKTCSSCRELTIRMKYECLSQMEHLSYLPKVLSKGKKNVQICNPEPGYSFAVKVLTSPQIQAQKHGG